jgi:hypothetical protein
LEVNLVGSKYSTDRRIFKTTDIMILYEEDILFRFKIQELAPFYVKSGIPMFMSNDLKMGAVIFEIRELLFCIEKVGVVFLFCYC